MMLPARYPKIKERKNYYESQIDYPMSDLFLDTSCILLICILIFTMMIDAKKYLLISDIFSKTKHQGSNKID
jgi:hypothetical protein